MSQPRAEHGEFAEAPGTVADHHQAERYARALKIMLVASPRQDGIPGLAKRMGYSREWVWRVLAVRRAPTETFLDRACEALGCEREMLDVLAGVQEDEHPLVQFLNRRCET